MIAAALSVSVAIITHYAEVASFSHDSAQRALSKLFVDVLVRVPCLKSPLCTWNACARSATSLDATLDCTLLHSRTECLSLFLISKPWVKLLGSHSQRSYR